MAVVVVIDTAIWGDDYAGFWPDGMARNGRVRRPMPYIGRQSADVTISVLLFGFCDVTLKCEWQGGLSIIPPYACFHRVFLKVMEYLSWSDWLMLLVEFC